MRICLPTFKVTRYDRHVAFHFEIRLKIISFSVTCSQLMKLRAFRSCFEILRMLTSAASRANVILVK